MLAPCGMNCMVCYKHCYSKKPCVGCLEDDFGKPKHCRACKIKEGTQSKGHTYCFECEDFPCKIMKNLDKSYTTRYDTSLVKNGLEVKATGLDAFMVSQKDRWTCLGCGGVISLHDAECSECQTKI